jgi:hypothetical protein
MPVTYVTGGIPGLNEFVSSPSGSVYVLSGFPFSSYPFCLKSDADFLSLLATMFPFPNIPSFVHQE